MRTHHPARTQLKISFRGPAIGRGMRYGRMLRPLYVVVVASMLKFIDVFMRHGVRIIKKCSHVLNGASETFVLSRAVDILSMSNFNDMNNEHPLFDGIQNAVLALSNTVPFTTG